MPDSLPNLMISSDASMLHHIENVSAHHRPSTVPSIDAYINRHVHEVGLGGEQISGMSQLQHSIGKHYGIPQANLNVSSGGKNSSNKLTQRALQSSFSSSLRARNNLSLVSLHSDCTF